MWAIESLDTSAMGLFTYMHLSNTRRVFKSILQTAEKQSLVLTNLPESGIHVMSLVGGAYPKRHRKIENLSMKLQH